MKKKRGILFGVVFICVLFFVIVFFVRNKESAEPVSKSDFKLNTVVTVTIYDLEEKEKKPDAGWPVKIRYNSNLNIITVRTKRHTCILC